MHRTRIIFLLVVAFLLGLSIGIYIGYLRGIPFISKTKIWSIGIYAGSPPFDLKPIRDDVNPVLSSKDVTDRDAVFVADPFMVKDGSTWYMFFEVMDGKTGMGGNRISCKQ